MIASPIPLGPFLVEDGGKLTFRRRDTDPAFSFQWRGRRFAVRLVDQRLIFAVPVGRVPSTSLGAARREAGLALLKALPAALPPGWSLRLLPDHRVQLETDQAMAWPATVGALLAPVIELVMGAAPVLDLMDEAGLA
jgi:hypothetical protein